MPVKFPVKSLHNFKIHKNQIITPTHDASRGYFTIINVIKITKQNLKQLKM
ncbi:hypothetical protein D322_439 [Yersinia enterocolitica IP 10393]|nr:hypothetical protein D322_439 [Yersinia enterocolitica IP 10393]